MDSITAQDFMVTKLVTLRPEMDVLDAARMLLKRKISGAPVVDGDGRLIGVFSEKCSMQVLLDAAYDGLPSSEVGAFMNADPQTISPDTQLLSIAQLFLLTSNRRLPVVDDDGKLMGQISRRDVLAAAMREIDNQSGIRNGRSKSLLYLSALVERDDAPVA